MKVVSFSLYFLKITILHAFLIRCYQVIIELKNKRIIINQSHHDKYILNFKCQVQKIN